MVFMTLSQLLNPHINYTRWTEESPLPSLLGPSSLSSQVGRVRQTQAPLNVLSLPLLPLGPKLLLAPTCGTNHRSHREMSMSCWDSNCVKAEKPLPSNQYLF